MTTMKQFHWFWAWDDEKEETWLREMAKSGWHFKSVTLPGNYVFEQGMPRDDVYRLDYLFNRKDMVNYLQIFQDAGWDYMGEMNSWQYFRKEARDGEIPEIYSDNESKSKKYQHIMLVLIIFLPIFANFTSILSRGDSDIMHILELFWAVWMVFYVYAMVRLLRRILQLKKNV